MSSKGLINLKDLLGNSRLIALAFFIAVLFGALDMGTRMMNMDGDLGRHLVVGQYIMEHRSIPTKDLFSSTMIGQPLSPHEWLAQLLFAAAYRLLGFSGVIVLTASILAICWYMITLEVMKGNRNPWVTLLLIIIGIAASSIHWLTRPHIFTFLYLLIFVNIYKGNYSTKNKFISLSMIMLFWVNTHGAFITAIIFLLIDFGASLIASIYEKVKISKLFPKAILIAAIFFVSLVNPVGIKVYETIFTFLGSRFLVAHTGEYQPPNLLTEAYFAYLIFLILGIVFMVLGRKKLTLPDLFQFWIWSIMGLISARNIPLAIIVGLPILSRWVGYRQLDVDPGITTIEINDRRVGNKYYSHFIIPMIVILLCAVYFWIVPSAGKQFKFQDAIFPVKAVDYISTYPLQGNSYNYFQWGGYLLYRLWPNHTVFIDGQTDFYGEALTKEYAEIITARPGYVSILDKYKINWLIIPINENLTISLNNTPQVWEKYYQDEVAVIFIRKTPIIQDN